MSVLLPTAGWRQQSALSSISGGARDGVVVQLTHSVFDSVDER
jgi:hypothetical protein